MTNSTSEEYLPDVIADSSAPGVSAGTNAGLRRSAENVSDQLPSIVVVHLLVWSCVSDEDSSRYALAWTSNSLAREQFDTLLEAKVLIERWRREYNTRRPHSSLGYRPPAPEAIQPASFASATPQQPKQAGVGTCPTLT
jgi:transposase InsO family protein